MKFNSGTNGIGIYIKGILTGISVSAAMILLFALGMYILGGGYKYSAVFATVSIAFGCFVSAFYIARKKETKGLLTGIAVGSAFFTVITLTALIINHGGLTVNTLFRLVIILLASVTGGIIGINRKSGHKYI